MDRKKYNKEQLPPKEENIGPKLTKASGMF